MPEVVEARLNFALHSPDFWRGLIIAFAVLTCIFVLRVLVNAVRAPRPVSPSGAKWGQVSGLISYMLLVIVAAGHQATRLGEITWSWRLVLSFLALCFGIIWAFEMTTVPDRFKERRSRRKK